MDHMAIYMVMMMRMQIFPMLGTYITVAKKGFSKLDKDNDGFISEHELEPVLDKLHLSECYYARQQATHAISEADKENDGRLTLEELTENPYAFYGSVFLSGDEDYFHDEFR